MENQGWSICSGGGGQFKLELGGQFVRFFQYTLVPVDSLDLKYIETDYTPVYSEIYHMDGTRRFKLTTTVSIRNTTLADSAYILKSTYYDSNGTVLREYLESALLLPPLASIEFVVEESEEFGGVGANFIVKWGANSSKSQILIQSIMIGTYGQQGISFVTDSRIIETHQVNN